jgi:hypothetical protein
MVASSEGCRGRRVLCFLEDLLIEFVFAGMLTSFVLGHWVLGLILFAVGVALLVPIVRYRRRRASFSGYGPSTTTATGFS